MENVRTIFANMPTSVKAYVISDPDGFYTIVLNQNLSYEQNVISCAHELYHIKHGDFECKNNVGLIEFNAHQI